MLSLCFILGLVMCNDCCFALLDTLSVRFINTISGKDVVVNHVELGENLLQHVALVCVDLVLVK